MTKRFEPNRRLLKTLVGSSLYGSPDACIRELVQNAWDAIQWRKTRGDGLGGEIEIRYSVSENWFEVSDDGFGMDQLAIEDSFLEIGQDKFDVLGASNRENQIGYFGIGVLSIFLVAEKFQVYTRRADAKSSGIRFDVTGIDDPIDLLEFDTKMIGTRIRVFPKDDGAFSVGSIPESVKNYARHVDGVFVSAIDAGTREMVQENWATENFTSVRQLQDIPGVRSSRIGLVSALKEQSGTLSSELIICNAGFLAERDVNDLLPLPTVGVGGEVDLEPHALTIGMSRERLQRDAKWTNLGTKLQDWFSKFALEQLSTGDLKRTDQLDSIQIKRNLLLWYHFIPASPPFLELYEAIEERIYETVPFTLAERAQSSLSRIYDEERGARKLFFRQMAQPTERTQNIDDEGMPIRVSEEIRDSIRVGALRAKGFDVVELNQIAVNLRQGNNVRTQKIDEQSLVARCIQKRGLELVDIANATEEDMDLRGIEKLPILKDALLIAGGLRFASVPDSMRRVITDRSGIKYINLRNQGVQNLLRVIPQAVSNPLKNKLLEAYLKMEDFKLFEARQILTELLNRDDLDSMASAEIAPLTRKYVEKQIGQLLRDLEQ